MQVWTNLCYRECFCKTNCWQELHFEFSRQNLNRNVQSPSMGWWLITQLRPIWKKAPPGLQRPSHTECRIPWVLHWPQLPAPHLGPDPRYPWGLVPPYDPIIKTGFAMFEILYLVHHSVKNAFSRSRQWLNQYYWYLAENIISVVLLYSPF